MSKSIEIEFKNLITEKEFTLLKNHLNISDSMFVKQENHYFDTMDFFLKKQGCALRIRQRNNRYECTLKEPLTEGLLETTQSLTKEEAENLLKGKPMMEGAVKDRLMELHFPLKEIQYFGTLTTERAQIEYKGGLLVLDYSSYLNESDYEVEYEVTNFENGQKVFNDLLAELHIPHRPTENKIQRFYNVKYNRIH